MDPTELMLNQVHQQLPSQLAVLGLLCYHTLDDVGFGPRVWIHVREWCGTIACYDTRIRRVVITIS